MKSFYSSHIFFRSRCKPVNLSVNNKVAMLWKLIFSSLLSLYLGANFVSNKLKSVKGVCYVQDYIPFILFSLVAFATLFYKIVCIFRVWLTLRVHGNLTITCMAMINQQPCLVSRGRFNCTVFQAGLESGHVSSSTCVCAALYFTWKPMFKTLW